MNEAKPDTTQVFLIAAVRAEKAELREFIRSISLGATLPAVSHEQQDHMRITRRALVAIYRARFGEQFRV